MTQTDSTQTAKPMTKAAIKAQDRQDALAKLRAIIKPGQIIYTILRGRSRSNMRRWVSVVIVNEEGRAQDVTYYAAIAMDRRQDSYHGHRAIVMGGYGYDAADSVVSDLAFYLFPGTKPAERLLIQEAL